MKMMKYLAVAGLMLAVAGTAGAVGIPFTQNYMGPVYMQISNWDMGTVYTPVLTTTAGGGAAADGVRYNASDLVTFALPNANLQPNENSWGIFRINTIWSGKDNGPDTGTIGNKLLYYDGLQGIHVYGMFYGRQDQGVVFANGGTDQKIYSTDTMFKIWTQTSEITNWDDGAAGPSGRLGLDSYTGIGPNGTGSELVLVAQDQPGFLTGFGGYGIASDSFFDIFTPLGQSGSGSYEEFLSLTGGTQRTQFDGNHFPNSQSTVTGYTADLRISGRITNTSSPTGDAWLAGTNDPVFGSYVPEPLTMLGVFLGVSGLGGYIRRRLAA